ncbi:MAG: hypothetical protein ACR2QC_10350 [Gammaproteobacteria bacterium]
MIPPWHRKIIAETPPAPATLILGREGDGRDILALALAASFAGAEKDANLDSIVGNLTAFKKTDTKKEWYIDKNTDIMAVRPDQEIIPIGAVRRIIEFCAIAPIAFARRAAAVLRAECMNGAAANALLKTLEEPSPDKILILSARAASLLPPTVVSRCRVLSAPPPDESQAREWVRRCGGDETTLAFCGGTPLAAAAADSRKIAAAAAHFAAGKNMDIHAAAQTMSAFDGWLDCLQKWVADGCRAASGLPARYFPGGEKRQAAMCGDPLRWLDVHAALLQKRRLAAHPLAADLFIKEILNDYRGIFVD